MNLNNDLKEYLMLEAKKENKLRSKWVDELKDLIDIDSLVKYLDYEMLYWMFEDIVEVYNTDEKSSGYSSYQHARVKDDKYKLLYMKQNIDEEFNNIIDHEYVWQNGGGYLGDDYAGYLLYPLNNGKYIRINYSC